MPHMGRRYTDPDTGIEMLEIQLTPTIISEPWQGWCPTCLVSSMIVVDVSLTGPGFPEEIVQRASCAGCGYFGAPPTG